MLPSSSLLNPPAFAASSMRLLEPLTLANSMSPPLLPARRLLLSVAVPPLAMPPPCDRRVPRDRDVGEHHRGVIADPAAEGRRIPEERGIDQRHHAIAQDTAAIARRVVGERVVLRVAVPAV